MIIEVRHAFLTERKPSGLHWTRAQCLPPVAGTLCMSAWRNGPIYVVSALELAELPDRSGTGPQWHISISRCGKRPKPHDVRTALRAFGMVDTEEDNHQPGVARHFWLPVDPDHRVECECKTDETLVVEPDGYTWTNPADGLCRGCEFAATFGKPCPVHK